jgi:hypothetical protein
MRINWGWLRTRSAAGVVYAVTVSAAAITFSAVSPTVLIDTVVTPAAGSITLSSSAPAVVSSPQIFPAAAAVTYTGQTPTAGADQLPAPATASVTYASTAPTVDSTLTLEPGAASVTYYAATAPAVIADAISAPATAVVAASTAAPIVVVDRISAPAAASVTYATAAPTVALGINVTPGAAAVTYAGATPNILLLIAVTPAAASITYAASAPAALVDAVSASAAASVTYASSAPTVISELPFSFVGALASNGAAQTITWPTGTVAGDIAIINVASQTPAWSNFSGWTTHINAETIFASLKSHVYSKVLTSGDISTPPSYTGVTNGGHCVAVYRGGSTVTKVGSVAGDTGTTCDVTGFTKNGSSVGIVGVFVGYGTGQNITPPSGWVEDFEGAITFFDFNVASETPADYTNSTTITWSMASSITAQNAVVLEIT